MHPLAREHLKKVLSRKEVVGSDESCEYYPCHFSGQDCTWCFCPFYPCGDEQTGGTWKRAKDGSLVWDCSLCFWIHRSEVAAKLMQLFTERGIKVEDIEREEKLRESGKESMLNEIFEILKGEFPPVRHRRI